MMSFNAIQGRAELLRRFDEQTLVGLLPLAVSISRKLDIDIADRARLLSDLTATAPPTRPANDHADEVGIEIRNLYDSLADLTSKGDVPGFRQTLRRLRILQAKEAERMTRFFDAHREVSGPAFRAAKKRAERLLAKHADTSASR